MTSYSVAESSPRWASAPGATIAKLLRAHHLSTDDLAEALNVSDPYARRLISGEAPITEELAQAISALLGSTPDFWRSREEQYRDSVAWLEVDDLVQRSPVDQMLQRGWIEETSSWQDQAKALLAYYDVPSAEAWTTRWGQRLSESHFRTSPSFESNDLSLAAWVRQAEIQAYHQTLGGWSPAALRSAIPELRGLTKISNPQKFLPIASTVLARAGVALVVIPSTPSNRLSGAALKLSSRARVIALTARHLSDDHLWFTLFHEIGHLLLHDAEEEFLDVLDAEESGESEIEVEANHFARDALLPNGVSALEQTRSTGPTMREVVAFAHAEGVSPGIVVGRLQYDKIVRYNQLRRLIRKYSWDGSSLKI